ncbi:hypothetical protein Xmau_03522 [Xenorhabdus mauleonii]|uniref:Uncharacterized protein n=1 Tax=Xenorhabdus mauleonii TaxID=351675 RepID=A0A1I3WUZ7_9GAMM|nr:hypothetical protein Xmau_03522 [Xenorhabdus mauleonii]SFK10296.1 hypothetical protein SAMN05421680_1299 [Xenorhabdus mauleonii]
MNKFDELEHLANAVNLKSFYILICNIYVSK